MKTALRVLAIVWIAGLKCSCGATDVLDGDIEDKTNCCLLLTTARVRDCIADFVKPGWCQKWTCPTTQGYICRDEDGTLFDPLPEWVIQWELD